jgi:tetratricopeptide (TPR) repeat protein
MIFNTGNIVEYLHNDVALKNADSDALQKFVEENPYSGLLQLVYCKYLHLHNDAKLEQQLEKCSLVVSDRKKVYEILFQPVLQQQIIEHETPLEKEQEIILESVPPIDITVAEEVTTIEKEIEVNLNETLLKQKEEQKENTKTLDELEKNILNEAINASIQVDISEYAKENDLDKKTTQKIKEQTAETTKEESERTIVHWFDKPNIKKEAKDTLSLIDDFLTTGKSKEKTQKEVFSPTNIAKLSLVANTQFVTETLATIYAKQGQIDKAIEIYQQLSLKNPEKKTFFASRIRFLKEKQQYNK